MFFLTQCKTGMVGIKKVPLLPLWITVQHLRQWAPASQTAQTPGCAGSTADPKESRLCCDTRKHEGTWIKPGQNHGRGQLGNWQRLWHHLAIGSTSPTMEQIIMIPRWKWSKRCIVSNNFSQSQFSVLDIRKQMNFQRTTRSWGGNPRFLVSNLISGWIQIELWAQCFHCSSKIVDWNMQNHNFTAIRTLSSVVTFWVVCMQLPCWQVFIDFSWDNPCSCHVLHENVIILLSAKNFERQSAGCKDWTKKKKVAWLGFFLHDHCQRNGLAKNTGQKLLPPQVVHWSLSMTTKQRSQFFPPSY